MGKKHSSLSNQDIQHLQQFYDYCKDGDLDKVHETLIINCNIDINWVNTQSSMTAIDAAVSNGHTEIILELIERKPKLCKVAFKHLDTDLNYSYTMSPLDIAASNGNYQIVKLLLKHGADIDITKNFSQKINEMISASHLGRKIYSASYMDEDDFSISCYVNVYNDLKEICIDTIKYMILNKPLAGKNQNLNSYINYIESYCSNKISSGLLVDIIDAMTSIKEIYFNELINATGLLKSNMDSQGILYDNNKNHTVEDMESYIQTILNNTTQNDEYIQFTNSNEEIHQMFTAHLPYNKLLGLDTQYQLICKSLEVEHC